MIHRDDFDIEMLKSTEDFLIDTHILATLSSLFQKSRKVKLKAILFSPEGYGATTALDYLHSVNQERIMYIRTNALSQYKSFLISILDLCGLNNPYCNLTGSNIEFLQQAVAYNLKYRYAYPKLIVFNLTGHAQISFLVKISALINNLSEKCSVILRLDPEMATVVTIAKLKSTCCFREIIHAEPPSYDEKAIICSETGITNDKIIDTICKNALNFKELQSMLTNLKFRALEEFKV